jgi:CRP/FNR family transcriptional regulator, cyclic AMP receptor protein
MYLMGALVDSDIDWLASHGDGLRLSPGQTLVQEGRAIDALFVVLDGQLTVKSGASFVATLLPGEVVGEISFVDSRPPLATVTADGAARVLAVRRDVLREKLDADPKFAANFYRALAIFLADRLRSTTAMLGYGPPEQDAAPEAPGLSDELGDELMETVSLGTRRFDNLLRQVRGG